MPKPIAVALLVACAFTTLAQAQSYPSKPVRILVPFPPGGGTDIVGRMVAQKLSESWGKTVVVDNRGGGVVAGDIVARAAADGYTLLYYGSTLWLLPLIRKDVPYDTGKDFTPVVQAISTPAVLVVYPGVPAKSVQELIALAKAAPGKINYGSSGTASSNHKAGEQLAHVAGIKITHVPYKGTGQTLIDLIGGQIGIATSSIIAAVPHIKSGRVRALAVTPGRRSSILPDIPTIAEGGLPGYAVDGWYGLVAPRNTSPEIIARLNREVTAILALPDIKATLLADGAEPAPGTPAAFQTTMADEIKKWTQLVRTAGIRLN